MRGKTLTSLKIFVFGLVILWLAGLFLPVLGQEPEEPEEPEQEEVVVLEPVEHIYITGNDITTPPNSVLHVYGRDLEGNAIDFNNTPVVLKSGDTVIPTTVSGTHAAGTFTVFLVDLPNSVEDQIPAIQDAILQFAGPGGGMQENVDSIAIYQVGETSPRQLMEPATFYNEVQNFFVDGLTPEEGSTALRDSLGALLEEVEALKPRPEMVTSVVVMSDGTDVVSTEYEQGDIINSALEKKIPINSVWVPGIGLTQVQQEQGQAYLQETADGTQGFAALLDDAGSVTALWEHIASFRDHARVVFQMDSLGGGVYDVTLSLADDPEVSDTVVVEIPENQPQVTIDLPEGSDTITLQSLDEPILLRLGATVSWLDGVEREISEARLRVNGLDVVDIPVDQLDDFTVEVSNLQFGPNELELQVVDEQGLRASNLPTVINVVEGERQAIPQELQPQRELGNVVLNVFLALVVLAVVLGIVIWLWRSNFFGRLTGNRRSRRKAQNVTYSMAGDPAAMGTMTDGAEQSGPSFDARLEVVEAVSDMPGSLPLTGAMIRIGRSPSMCDIAFRDDLTVSRQHAVLMLEGNHYRLFDENSTSGSWVNGRQVPEYGVELADGDEIHLGAVHMMYRQF
jgi:hypothetical protein